MLNHKVPMWMPCSRSILAFGPGFAHDKARRFTRIHRVVVVLEDEMLHEVVLRHDLAAHRALVSGGFLVAPEVCTTTRRGQTRHGSQQGRHEDQPEQHEAAAQSAEEARARPVLRQA